MQTAREILAWLETTTLSHKTMNNILVPIMIKYIIRHFDAGKKMDDEVEVSNCVLTPEEYYATNCNDTKPCNNFQEDTAIAWSDGEPKGQCANCGFKEEEHKQGD
jgi:hypothetical protein